MLKLRIYLPYCAIFILLANGGNACTSTTNSAKILAIPKSASAIAMPGTDKTSWGEPLIYAILAKQWSSGDGINFGARIDKLCVMKTSSGRAVYSLYWYQRMVRAASVDHAQAALIVVSASRNMLGHYGVEMGPAPKCWDKQFSEFTSSALPLAFENEGYEPFQRLAKFKGATKVDGVSLPNEELGNAWYGEAKKN